MIDVVTRDGVTTVDTTYEEFKAALVDGKSSFIELNGQLTKKADIRTVRPSRSSNLRQIEAPPEIEMSLEERRRGAFVLAYLKTYTPKYIKQKGSALTAEESRAIIAEAKAAYEDGV